MDIDALVYEVEQAIMQGTDRLAALDVTRKALNVLVARFAELAAATRPIAFAEREPERGAKVLLWWVHYGRWTACNGYAPGSYQADDGEPVFTHWLPCPPAPDTAA